MQILGKWEYLYKCGYGRTFLVRQEIQSHADRLTHRLQQCRQTDSRIATKDGDEATSPWELVSYNTSCAVTLSLTRLLKAPVSRAHPHLDLYLQGS